MLHASYSGLKFQWGADCQKCVAEILERLTAPTRLPCRPAGLMRKGWRLVIKSDGCDKGVGACLLLVRPDENGEVTAEMHDARSE